MVTVKELTVKITYRVGLIDVEMPQKVYDELVKASENIDEIDPSTGTKYGYAADWLGDNIKECDSFDWSAEIEEVS